jgi:putative Mg2+ transporter-C (MgtC) family protein
MPIWLIHLFRTAVAAALGAAIGLERQRSGKVAGVRTNMLICLGAAVLTILSREIGQPPDDSAARIAAQIVPGIGFLGAGVIIRDRGGVHGLTTAATIWLVASVGMAVGAGYYALAIGTTGLALAVLVGLRKWPRHSGSDPE